MKYVNYLISCHSLLYIISLMHVNGQPFSNSSWTYVEEYGMKRRWLGLEKIKVINHVFFDLYKFKGHIQGLNTHTFYINNLLESKNGNAMSIGILYLLITQRNKLFHVSS